MPVPTPPAEHARPHPTPGPGSSPHSAVPPSPPRPSATAQRRRGHRAGPTAGRAPRPQRLLPRAVAGAGRAAGPGPLAQAEAPGEAAPLSAHPAVQGEGTERSTTRRRLHPRPAGPAALPGTRRPPPRPAGGAAPPPPCPSPRLAAGRAPARRPVGRGAHTLPAGSVSGLGQRPARAPQLSSDAHGQRSRPAQRLLPASSAARRRVGPRGRSRRRYSTPLARHRLTRGGSASRSRRRRARPPATAPGGAGGGACCSIALRLLLLLLLRGPPPPPAGPIPLRTPGSRRHVPGPALGEPHCSRPRPRGWAAVGPRTAPGPLWRGPAPDVLRLEPGLRGPLCCVPLPPRQPPPLLVRRSGHGGRARPPPAPHKKIRGPPLQLTPVNAPAPRLHREHGSSIAVLPGGGGPSPEGGSSSSSLSASGSGVSGAAPGSAAALGRGHRSPVAFLLQTRQSSAFASSSHPN